MYIDFTVASIFTVILRLLKSRVTVGFLFGLLAHIKLDIKEDTASRLVVLIQADETFDLS